MVASKYAFVSVDTRGKSYVPDAMIAAVSYLNGTPSVSGSLQTGQYLESTQSEVPLGLKVTSSSHAWLLSAGGAPGGVGDIYVRDITIGSNSVSASSRSFVAAYPHATGGSQIHSSGKMMVSHAFQPFGVDGYISCLDLASATSGTPVNMQSLGAIVNPIWNPYMVMMTDSLAFILPNGRYSGGISGGGSACGRSMHTLALSGTTISSVSPVPTDSGSFGSNLHDTLINWNAYRTDVVAAYHIDSTRVFVFYFGKVGEDLYSTPMAGVVCELRARVVTVSGHGSMSLGPELVVCAAAEDWSYHDGIYGTPWHDHHFHFPDGRFDGLPSINLDGTFSFVTAATISGLRTFYRFTVSVSGTSCSVASIERVDSGRSWGPYKMAETAVGKYVGYFSTKGQTDTFPISTIPSNWQNTTPWAETRTIGGFGEFDMGASPLKNQSAIRTNWSRDTVNMCRSMSNAITHPAVASNLASPDPRYPYKPIYDEYALGAPHYFAHSGLLAAVPGRTDTVLQVSDAVSRVAPTAQHDLHVALLRTQKRTRSAGTVELRAYQIADGWEKKKHTQYVTNYTPFYGVMPVPSYTVLASQSRAQFNPDWIESFDPLPYFPGSNDPTGWRDLAALVPDQVRWYGYLNGVDPYLTYGATPTHSGYPYSKWFAYRNYYNDHDRFPVRPGDLVVMNGYSGYSSYYPQVYSQLWFYDANGTAIGGIRDSTCVAPAGACSVGHEYVYYDPSQSFYDSGSFDFVITPKTSDIFTGAVSASTKSLVYAGPRATGSSQRITIASPETPFTVRETHTIASGSYVLGVYAEQFTNYCWWLTISATHLRWYRSAEGSGQPLLRFSAPVDGSFYASIGGVPRSWFCHTDPNNPAAGYVFFNKQGNDLAAYYLYPGGSEVLSTGTYAPYGGITLSCFLKKISIIGTGLTAIEAESAAHSGSLSTASPYAGHTGSSNISNWTTNGQFVRFSFQSPGGDIAYNFRYSAQLGAAVRELRVNGYYGGLVEFPGTDTWTDWAYSAITGTDAAAPMTLELRFNSSSGSTGSLVLDNLSFGRAFNRFTTFGYGQPMVVPPPTSLRPKFLNTCYVKSIAAGKITYGPASGYEPKKSVAAYLTISTSSTRDTTSVYPSGRYIDYGLEGYGVGPVGTWNYAGKIVFDWVQKVRYEFYTDLVHQTALLTITGNLKGFGYPLVPEDDEVPRLRHKQRGDYLDGERHWGAASSPTSRQGSVRRGPQKNTYY